MRIYRVVLGCCVAVTMLPACSSSAPSSIHVEKMDSRAQNTQQNSKNSHNQNIFDEGGAGDVYAEPENSSPEDMKDAQNVNTSLGVSGIDPNWKRAPVGVGAALPPPPLAGTSSSARESAQNLELEKSLEKMLAQTASRPDHQERFRESDQIIALPEKINEKNMETRQMGIQEISSDPRTSYE